MAGHQPAWLATYQGNACARNSFGIDRNTRPQQHQQYQCENDEACRDLGGIRCVELLDAPQNADNPIARRAGNQLGLVGYELRQHGLPVGSAGESGTLQGTSRL